MINSETEALIDNCDGSLSVCDVHHSIEGICPCLEWCRRSGTSLASKGEIFSPKAAKGRSLIYSNT